MKSLRVLLLVLLALLLPVRGAVAAAMLCPEGSHGDAMVEASTHHHGMRDAAGASHHHDDGAPAHADDHADSAAHASGCNVCASFCSMTPMLSAMPVLQKSVVVSALTFPVLAVPASTFQSDGQERPPRSI